MMRFVSVAAAAWALSACAAPTSPNTAGTPQGEAALKRVWMLTKLDGFSKDRLVALKAEMNWTNLPAAGVYMGCNRLMFQAKPQADGKVSFGPVAATRMYCAEQMDVESAFAAALPTVTHYQIQGHHLILRGSKGEMHFVAQDWD
ncbi:META domain-containing protein [Conchiformibius steedae]|uniref:META domain-containing protein n=1 Tax=Conchiformibius steedae TaxID=153493 RepID=UPI0026E948DF|nr:META domain-containing protein [Conchiformibius steedae]